MKTVVNALSVVVALSSHSIEDRMRLAKEYLGQALRFSLNAMCLEAQHLAALELVDRLSAEDDTRAWALATVRARTIHHERCEELRRAADASRHAVSLACGSLSIDESTADTCLSDEAKRVISEVSGRMERW